MIKRPEFWAMLVFYRMCGGGQRQCYMGVSACACACVCVLQKGGELAKEIGGSSEIDGIGCGSGFWLNDEAGMWV